MWLVMLNWLVGVLIAAKSMSSNSYIRSFSLVSWDLQLLVQVFSINFVA